MARLPRDARLETREARLRLPPPKDREPFWKQLQPGLFIGYRKNPTGGVWMARVSARSVGRIDGAAYIKKTLGTADDFADSNGTDVLSYREAFAEALDFAEKLKAHDKPADKYTVADAVQDYMEGHYAREGRAPRETQYAIDRHILPKLGKLLVKDLRAETINTWLIGLTRAPVLRRGNETPIDRNDHEAVRKRKASANRILTILKASLNHAYRAGKASSDDAWRRVRPFRSADAPKIRYLSEDEARRLLNGCETDFRELVRGALATGCRYGELIQMQAHDFDADAGAVYVRRSKSGKARHVPLTDEGLAWFEQWTAGRPGDARIFTRADGLPWQRDHQHRRMKDACGIAGILPAISFHDLRHTYASFLATRGVPDQVIAEALGHADTRMTVRHYAHLKPSFVADQLRAHLPALESPSKPKVSRLSRSSKTKA